MTLVQDYESMPELRWEVAVGMRKADDALVAAVLDEEAARQAAQARAKEQIIFPDDLLPGVHSEPVSFTDAFKVGGKLMFIVLLLLYSFDELEGADIGLAVSGLMRASILRGKTGVVTVYDAFAVSPLGGCAVTPSPLMESDVANLAGRTIADVAKDQEPISGPVDLHQAVARAQSLGLVERPPLATPSR